MNERVETGPGTRAAVSMDETRGSVIVGVDGSEHARNAASWAAGEAVLRGRSLTLANALYLHEGASIPPPPEHLVQQWRQEAHVMVQREAERLKALFPDLQIGMISSDIPPAPFLADLSERGELLVTGTRGHGGFAGMLVGSVSRKLAAHAHCPLIVAGTELSVSPRNEVVLGVGKKPSEDAVRFAFDAASRYGATLTVVRAWWPTAAFSSLTAPGSMYVEDVEDLRTSVLSEAEAATAAMEPEYPAVEVNTMVNEGNSVSALVDAARGARLLVIGGHRHRGPLSVGPGYVVEGAVAHSVTPVAVVPIR